MNEERLELMEGQQYGFGPYFALDVLKVGNDVYPYVKTGDATMTLPWRYGPMDIEVCLLAQRRAETANEETLKVSGGYSHGRESSEMALHYTKNKLGLVPGERPLVFWRKCLGVGPQYQFPIEYTFLMDPVSVGEPTTEGCRAHWVTIKEALSVATQEYTPFFDDFSLAHLAILAARHTTFAKRS